MHIPELGPLIPRKGNTLTRAIGRFLLFTYRWQVRGEMFNSRKFVIIRARQTTSWDFYTPIATMLAVGFWSSWLIAAAYTWWPLGILMRWLGGIPVHRSASHNMVSQVVKSFNDCDDMVLSIFPEGGRRKVARWKTGFWHIAVLAEVPIQLVSLDYDNRVTEFGPVIEPSNDIEADMKLIQDYFKDVRAKRPDQFGGEYL